VRGPPRLLKSHYLRPGEFVVTREDVLVGTVLGSCVSVCLFHREGHVAAMCHSVLPYGVEVADRHELGYCIDQTLAHIIQRLQDLGAGPQSLLAKILGGANSFDSGGAGRCVGERNVSAAREALQAGGVAVVAEHVGGKVGRKVHFRTTTGEAWVRLLGRPRSQDPV
jgi:chemotaxis protein CheD